MRLFPPLLFVLVACSAARAQNAQPNSRRLQLARLTSSSSSSSDSDFYAQRDAHLWAEPPEAAAAAEDANERSSALQPQQAKALQPEPEPDSSSSLSEFRRRTESSSSSSNDGVGEGRRKKRRRAKQSWRARENLVDAGGRNRLRKKQPQPRGEALQAFGATGANRARKFREERRRRRRNRKRARGQRLGLESRAAADYGKGPVGRLMRALRQQLRAAASLEDNPLNLSMTRSAEIDEVSNVLEPSNLTGQPTTEPQPTSASAATAWRLQPALPVEREFSRHVEREFAKSGRQQQQQHEVEQEEEDQEQKEERDEGRQLPKFDERSRRPSELRAPFDPERVLGYSRTDEDLPILELENEVLQRTINDYNAYMSSSLLVNKPDKERADSRRPPPANEQDEQDEQGEQQRGDLSCVNATFLPAPFVRHAVIKYVKSSRPGHEYLEADYECEEGYALSSGGNASGRLLCHERRWIGRLPSCRYRLHHDDDDDDDDDDKDNEADSVPGSCRELACEQLCRIVDGKPRCSCRPGFRLHGSACVDVNECEEAKEAKETGSSSSSSSRGPCEDTCRNLEGGFECGCESTEGSRLASDGRSCVGPVPRRPRSCEHENAGCSHACLASMGRVFCLCPEGFVLEDDWKTCQDVNECALPELQTELCRYGCVNTPGSYHCAPAPAAHPTANCQPGYQLDPAAIKNCIDVDECASNNGGCSEICENTEGSFFCACEGDERVLSVDRRSCVVAEERFEKMDREAALSSMRLRQVVSCSALNPVGRGYLMCSDGSSSEPPPLPVPGDDAGQEDEGEEEEEQEEEEDEDEDEEDRKHNERQRTPIRPGTKCHLACPRGYELHGEYELTCRADGTWDGPKHGECLRYSKPRLDCPKPVLAELPAGRDEAFVTYEQPSTDLDWFRYVRSKPSWGTRLEANLKLGLHQISFYARHPVSKQQASCTLNITVQEGQAPKVDNCPSDIEVSGKNGSAISWLEPVFTDNVRVSRVTSSQSPGQTFSFGGHKVEYEAADEAGWTTKCIFTVVLRPPAE